MAVYKIKWSNLLFLTELDFIPERPAQLIITDEIVQSISWLTGVTRHDRKLLRCDDNGVLLTDNAWANLIEVELAELIPDDGVPDTVTCTVPNKGLLITTSTQLVKITFVRYSGADEEDIYLPPGWLYWFGHPCCDITATTVPAAGGTISYVGVTAFN